MFWFDFIASNRCYEKICSHCATGVAQQIHATLASYRFFIQVSTNERL
jgi:hypothetical protein